MRRRGLIACSVSLFLAVVLPLAPAGAESSGSVRRQLDALVERLQAAEARENQLQVKLVKLDREIRRTEKALADIRGRFAGRARAAYVGGLGGDPITVMVSSKDPGQVLSRLSLLEAASRGDTVLLAKSRNLRRALKAQRDSLTATQRDARAVERSLALDTMQLNELFRKATGAEQESARRSSRRSRASRSASAPAPRLSGSYACLVGPNHAFRNTWGAPRSGGRRHKGTDVFAGHGTPSYAVTSGVVRRLSSSGNGGLQVYLMGDDGNEYFYAHMASYATRAGKRVAAGDLIAYVGSTGNADRSAPHVHFEVHPGGGSPVNPYSYVRRFCG